MEKLAFGLAAAAVIAGIAWVSFLIWGGIHVVLWVISK